MQEIPKYPAQAALGFGKNPKLFSCVHATTLSGHIMYIYSQPLLDAAIGDCSVRLRFTREFYYNNCHRAVAHGIPPDLRHLPPSNFRGGEARLDYVIALIKEGKVSYAVVSEDVFLKRKQHAIDHNLYDPEIDAYRQGRSDKGGYHYRSRRKLWGPVPPKTTATVDDAGVEMVVAALRAEMSTLR